MTLAGSTGCPPFSSVFFFARRVAVSAFIILSRHFRLARAAHHLRRCTQPASVLFGPQHIRRRLLNINSSRLARAAHPFVSRTQHIFKSARLKANPAKTKPAGRAYLFENRGTLLLASNPKGSEDVRCTCAFVRGEEETGRYTLS